MSASQIFGIIVSAFGSFGVVVSLIPLFFKVKDERRIELSFRAFILLLVSIAIVCLGLSFLSNCFSLDNIINFSLTTKISFDQENIIYMEEGTEKTLVLDISPNNDEHPIVQWRSWNPDIVDVNGSGKNGTAYTATPIFGGIRYTINAVGTGTAQVEVSYEESVANCIVVVTTKNLQLCSGPFAQALVGGSFMAYIEPFYLGDCDDLHWTSSDTSVATVYDCGISPLNTLVGLKDTHAGTVNAVGSGVTTITVSCDGQSASFTLLVTEEPLS